MGIWIVIIVMGIFTLLSFYMAFLGLRMGDSGAYFFVASGMFCGIFFILALIKYFSRKSAWVKKVDEKIAGETRPVSFVPHWFIMAAITIAGIAILAAILMPKFFR